MQNGKLVARHTELQNPEQINSAPEDPSVVAEEEEVEANENELQNLDRPVPLLRSPSVCVSDSWFDGVKDILAASVQIQQGAGINENDFASLVRQEQEFDRSKPSVQDGVSQAVEYRGNNPQRGFYNSDVILMEAKHGGYAYLGSGMLLQDPSTWGPFEQNDENRRFVLTAAHCVCSTQYDKITIYDELRIKVPIKPWGEMDLYDYGADATDCLYTKIEIKSHDQIFIHPKYCGKWHDCTDIALVAIPEVQPTVGSMAMCIWPFEDHPTSSIIVGYPTSKDRNTGQILSHLPYYSPRYQENEEDGADLKMEFIPDNSTASIVRYHCETYEGMSGGAVVLDDMIVGIHVAGDQLLRGCANGVLFTEEHLLWMREIFAEWDRFNLGEHQIMRMRDVEIKPRKAAPKRQKPITWSSEKVQSWLQSVGLDMYKAVFEENKVDGKMLLDDIDAAILKEDLGVKGLHVKKFEREIAALKKI